VDSSLGLLATTRALPQLRSPRLGLVLWSAEQFTDRAASGAARLLPAFPPASLHCQGPCHRSPALSGGPQAFTPGRTREFSVAVHRERTVIVQLRAAG
jgi:hypothetical protein